ncbi:FadR/GntR family transcriptional regulator [Rhizobium sp. BK376]|uniref:FadR/GntR family transcriptional regulator n=1 Tax=Rhizobium sp. BK376 TaxID=2512149 RepID=UPI0010514549|nr:FadR/GntR family transcriptional regulator [Rhizobium sp. BK376]TCR80161.1 GntR family transcriptional regulator [Rhizobium sp. BK376]
MALKLDKVNRGPHLSTLVASSISREIAQGRLKPGDQLPTEQQLATTFGVSRNVVREAIARLRSEGRIWSQQGRGAFVADQPNATVLTIDYEALQQANAFQSLFELRGILEVEGAALAAGRRTDSDLSAMRDALTTMQAAPYGSVMWLKTDLEFHKTVAAATGNPYMVQFLTFVSERVRESILASGNQQRSEDLAAVTLGEHQRILDAIEARQADEARDAMRQHLHGAASRVGLAEEQSE